jgi:DNA mismatch repair protein MutL
VRTARAAEAELAARAAYALHRVESEQRAERDAAPWDEAQLAEGSTPTPAPGFFASLTYLGQLDLTYLVCEGEGELVLIDQHVAHERVELARLKAGQGERDVPTQRLLFPTTIELEPRLLAIADRMTDVLAQVGYEAEGFGKGSLAVKAVPGGIRHGDPTHLLRKLLGDWAEDGAPSEAERLDRVLAEIACHSVVRAGDRLSPSEAEALLRSMDGADFTSHGVHGRPVMLRMSLGDIARRFGR